MGNENTPEWGRELTGYQIADAELLAAKKRVYSEYRSARDEMQNLQMARANCRPDHGLGGQDTGHGEKAKDPLAGYALTVLIVDLAATYVAAIFFDIVGVHQLFLREHS